MCVVIDTSNAPAGFKYPKFDSCLWVEFDFADSSLTIKTDPRSYPSDIPKEYRDANPLESDLGWDVFALANASIISGVGHIGRSI